MRKLALIAASSLFVLLTGAAFSQELDGAFGVSGVLAPSAGNASANFTPQSIGGGAFTGFSGDFLFKRQFGVGGEANWRARRNIYGGFRPFRPIFYDFNAVWAPRLTGLISAELEAGIGGASIRFYQPFITCNFFSCTNFSSVNHFLGHFGGGIRYYIRHNIFIRPEAHFYAVRNNFEFSGSQATRVGVSIGYSFRGE